MVGAVDGDLRRQLKYLDRPWCLFPHEDSIHQTEPNPINDASEEAFCGVVFISHGYADGNIIGNILHEKTGTKWAPTKTLSIPKLELNAALHGTRIAKFLQKILSRAVNRHAVFLEWAYSSTTQN